MGDGDARLGRTSGEVVDAAMKVHSRLGPGLLESAYEACLAVAELKAVEKLHPIHQAQLLSNLRLSGYRIGLLINFHEMRLKDGIKRFVNNW